MTAAIEELGTLAQLLTTEQQEDLRQYELLLRQSPIAQRRKEGLTWHPVKVVETGFGLGS